MSVQDSGATPPRDAAAALALLRWYVEMGADLRALLDDADPKLATSSGGELLQTDCRRKAGGPGSDHDNIVLHPLALGPLLAHFSFLEIRRTTISDRRRAVAMLA